MPSQELCVALCVLLKKELYGQPELLSYLEVMRINLRLTNSPLVATVEMKKKLKPRNGRSGTLFPACLPLCRFVGALNNDIAIRDTIAGVRPDYASSRQPWPHEPCREMSPGQDNSATQLSAGKFNSLSFVLSKFERVRNLVSSRAPFESSTSLREWFWTVICNAKDMMTRRSLKFFYIVYRL